MKYLSLFSGIGGFELGIEKAHGRGISIWNRRTAPRHGEATTPLASVEPTEASLLDFRDSPHHLSSGNPRQIPHCIGFSEIDKYAISIYKRHFPEHKNYGDITKIDPATLPDIDLMCGGFPCQAFSIAGKRRGFEDTRGTLFFEICRLAEAKRPRLLLLENVKGLLSHDGGRTFYTIISALNELGYDCQWQVLNGADWVPQNRERVFIVANSRGTPRPQVFPFGRSGGEDTRRNKEVEVYDQQNDYWRTDGLVGTLQAEALKRRNRGFALKQDAAIRRLTPLECERLMGMPDGWTEYGVNEAGDTVPISDTQRYKVCGNGVIPQMVAAVVSRLL